MEKNFFKSKGTKTLDDVRAIFGNDCTLKRCPTNSRKYTLTNKDGDERYFRYMDSMDDMVASLEKLGVEKFLTTFKIDSLEPRNKMTKEERQVKRASAAKRAVKKSNKAEVEALREKKQEVALKLMRMDLKKGSPEHKALKTQLHELHHSIKELVGDERVTEITADDIRDAVQEGERKKRQRATKEKRAAKKAALKKSAKKDVEEEEEE